MIQVFIWLIALTAAATTGAAVAIQFALGRRTYLAVLAATCVLAAVYFLIGADALQVAASRLESGWVLLLNFGVVVLAAAAVAAQFGVHRWLVNDRPAAWRQAGIATLLLCQIAACGWIGWRFQHAIFSMSDAPMSGGIGMKEIPGEALLTDKGHLVPVYQSDISGNLQGYVEYTKGAFAERRIERSASDVQANCHGWVFTGGHYLLKGNGVETILADNDYRLVERPQAGDVIVYRDIVSQIVHTGLVRAAWGDDSVLIESKWGLEGRFLHLPEDQDYSQSFTYYRRSRSRPYLDGDSPHLVQAVRVLPGNLVVAQRPGEALVAHPQPADQPLMTLYGQPLPMGESYPIGAE